MRCRPLALCLLLVPFLAPAQDQPAFLPTIKLPASEQPVELANYALAVQVRGLFAECTATMTFRNPNHRQLAGDLEFPLPDHATVSGYALDIGQRMVDGVVVGNDRARVVLEAEQRQRVDPGLVEQVRGNLFRTRIWPLPAEGKRTVAVTWVQELAVRDDEAALRVALPHSLLSALTLHVEIAAGEVEPRLGGFGNLTLTRWQGRSVADATLTDVTPGDDLLVRLPDLPRQLVQIENREGERFVAISERPDLPDLATTPLRRLAVAWDASGSRSADSIARGRDVLAGIFARCPGCIVDLVVFRDVPEAPRVCTDAASLLAAIDSAPCDGGTGLARLDLRRAALPHADDRCWVLVSDGFGTLGEGLPANGDVPVFCVSGDRERDLGLLRLLAARTGGALVDCLSGDAATAAAVITAPPAGLLRIEAGGNLLSDVESSFAGGRATVLARLTGSGLVTLVYGSGGQECTRSVVALGVHLGHGPARPPGVPVGAPIVQPAPDAERGAPVPGGVIARAWAGARATSLGVFREANRAELVAIGQRYHLVTPGTSLLVLESLDQYLRHHIEPPASWPELHDGYPAALKQRGEGQQVSDQAHLEQVVGWWQDRIAWLTRVAPFPEPEVLVETPAMSRVARIQGGRRAPTTPAAPAPQPVAGSDAEAEERSRTAETGGQEAFMAIGAGGESSGRFGSGGKSRSGSDGPARITITPFDPDSPALRALRAAPADQAYATYLRERPAQAASPGFFLDCAGFFLPRDAALGRRVLSNLAELRLDDPGLLRVFAWRLQEAGDADTAVAVLRTVLRLRPEEPQSYRDLALALAARGEVGHYGADVTEAMALLHRVVLRQPLEDVDLGDRNELAVAWGRFPQIEVIANEELNRLLAVTARGAWDKLPVVPPLDPRLKQLVTCDLRVVMSWDVDATDIDLHVVEPSGEEAFYGHQRTRSGALVSNDLTQGYGPEEYLLPKAPSGAYRIHCHFYGTRMQTLLGPATVTAMAITDWGRPTEQRRMLTLRLQRQGESIPVGEIVIGSSATPVPATGSVVTIDQLRALTVGMARPAVEAKLGQPLRVDNDGVTVLVYQTAKGTFSRLGFGPDLLWAREAFNGAERDVLVR